MEFIKNLQIKARELQKRVVLPESGDPRVLQAASDLIHQKLASEVITIGRQDAIQRIAEAHQISLNGVQIIDPDQYSRIDEMAHSFYELRKHKGMTESKAAAAVRSELFFGAMLLKDGLVDGMIAGAANSTGNVIRSGLYIIKPRPGNATISSCFLMQVPNCEYGHGGIFVFGDCAVVPDPSSDQLADIAVESAQTCRQLLHIEPVVAFLSFSTKGSASHPHVDKVVKAVQILKEKEIDFVFDGEMQVDAAIIEAIGRKKAPDSKISGHTNIFIFPDLNAGNIGYKLVERLAGAAAIGPVLQGFNKPINDLSRGCSVEDIVNVAAITILQGA